MMVPIFALLALGIFLENRFNIFTTIPCLVIGILTGCRNTYILAKKASGKSETEREVIAEQKMVDAVMQEWNDGRQYSEKKDDREPDGRKADDGKADRKKQDNR